MAGDVTAEYWETWRLVWRCRFGCQRCRPPAAEQATVARGPWRGSHAKVARCLGACHHVFRKVTPKRRSRRRKVRRGRGCRNRNRAEGVVERGGQRCRVGWSSAASCRMVRSARPDPPARYRFRFVRRPKFHRRKWFFHLFRTNRHMPWRRIGSGDVRTVGAAQAASKGCMLAASAAFAASRTART